MMVMKMSDVNLKEIEGQKYATSIYYSIKMFILILIII